VSNPSHSEPDIRVRNFAGGISCPNPFWLASAPPTNCGEQIMRAFDAGWGGAVWKTIGAPVTNVTSRYSSIDWQGQRMMGFNNIELISDRPIETNLRELAEVKKRYPAHAVIASLMVESTREAWHDIVVRSEDAGADGLELNFGCPHGMSERGMGSAVGQVPEYAEMITAWVKEKARTPVLVKLTPNISDIRTVARAARRGGADGLSAINTINSITGIDLDTLIPRPNVDGRSSHGGYCGPAVKPIALNMVKRCCLFRALEALPTGLMRRSFCCWVAGLCRYVQLRCTLATASWKTWPMGSRIGCAAKAFTRWMIFADCRCIALLSGSTSTSTTRSLPISTSRSALVAIFATSPAGMARISAFTWTELLARSMDMLSCIQFRLAMKRRAMHRSL